jgi:hypothetical protein
MIVSFACVNEAWKIFRLRSLQSRKRFGYVRQALVHLLEMLKDPVSAGIPESVYFDFRIDSCSEKCCGR